MKRLGFCAALLWALASVMSAQTPRTRSAQTPAARRPVVVPAPPETFQKYCFECHSGKTPEADLSIENLVTQPSGLYLTLMDKMGVTLDKFGDATTRLEEL